VLECPLCHGSDLSSPDLVHPAVCADCHLEFYPPGSSRVTLVSQAISPREAPPLHLDLPESFLSRYPVGGLLGAGGLGCVYRAENLATGAPVAIKFLRSIDNEEALLRFLREGKLTLRVGSPLVITVIEIDRIEGIPFIVMPMFERGSLRDMMKLNGRLSIETALPLMLDVLEGLQDCHSAEILHRDIKPENILLNSNGRAVITDLGIAREFESNVTSLTQTGQFIGTPNYMAQEAISGRPIGPATDLYAAGIMFYEMLAGRPPFRANQMPFLLDKHLNEEPPPLDVSVPNLPKEVVAGIHMARAKRTEDRPTSPRHFAVLLAPSEVAAREATDVLLRPERRHLAPSANRGTADTKPQTRGTRPTSQAEDNVSAAESPRSLFVAVLVSMISVP